MKEQFDIVIPCARRDIDFLPRVIKYIRKNLVGAERIFLITSSKSFSKLSKLVDKDLMIIDEDKLLDYLSFNKIKELLSPYKYEEMTGWYLQQFIKLGFSRTKFAKDYYLTWDSDTLPLNKIPFFEDGHPLFTAKREYNPSYFTTIERLFGYGRQVNYSFVAEQMLFKTSVVLEMLNEIEKVNVLGANWVEKIINVGDYSMTYAPFSEFETYGNYCVTNHPDLYSTRKLCSFRGAGYIRGRQISDKMLDYMGLDLDIASFEIYQGPMFPFNIQSLYYKNIRRIKRYKRMPILSAIKLIILKLKGKDSSCRLRQEE